MTPIILPSEDRFNTKQQMVDLRTAHFGICYCDLCHKEHAWDMHEIVTRKATQNFEWLRKLSFQAPICSILCTGCHDHIAPTQDGIERLLRFNIRLYTFKVVKETIYTIPESFWTIAVAKAWRVVIAA